jgi:hypothetical protein
MFFTRHMRILERCKDSASQEVRVQIDALREAFSQDTNQPFELKANLGLRSPASDEYPKPVTMQASTNPSVRATPTWQQVQSGNAQSTISPTADYGPPFEHPPVQAVMPFTTLPMSTQQVYASTAVPYTSPPPQDGFTMAPEPVWDPSGIFQQWNTAFGSQAPPQQPPANDQRLAPNSAPILAQNPPVPQQAIYGHRHTPPNVGPQVPPDMSAMSSVWQDVFTNAYVSGHGKRYRVDDTSDYGQHAKRRG